MTRRSKREFLARIITLLLVVSPISVGVIASLLLYSYLGWEGRAGAIAGLGGAISLGLLALLGSMWDDHRRARESSHLKGTSFLLNWIEEPEPQPKPKPEPLKPGTWREDNDA